MDYLQTVGHILREIRIARGLSREDCSQALNRDHLAKVEQGRLALTIVKFRALCDLLRVAPSQVFFAVEARLSETNFEDHLAQQVFQIRENFTTGILNSEANLDAIRGVRGKLADDTRDAIRLLQADGLRKVEIIRKLQVSRSTVDRYWIRS